MKKALTHRVRNHDVTHWVNSPDKTPEDKVGFVYSIKNKTTGKSYIGIKKYWKPIRRKPLKGKKRVRLDTVESDWRTYKTSSPKMQNELTHNPSNYVCTILTECDSITEMKAKEAYIQLSYYMQGMWGELENEVINLRLRIPK